ncbi:ABC transporter permease [Frigidibacter sp. ROC022]|uniref:ABC transporter permease n=1 Tax=Frigidibacter sp. ROC022 TaxID=2971796 RepID=UPI00215B26F6|nr:ABC transporter permease [Frigidibacter sp. ROC022]MCR8725386.1 ABC transporter permease [Frigidibacter sp. ROC022]
MRKSLAERSVDWVLGGLTVITFLVLYTPVLISAIFSIVPTDRNGVHWNEASLQWYGQLLGNTSVLNAVETTLIVGLISVAIATALAIAIALYVEWEGAMMRRLLELFVYLPFLMPPIITGLSLLIYFNGLGIPRGTATIAIGHVALVLAILYRLVLTRLQSIPRSMIEASADLGATRWQTFARVIWPQLRSAAVTGAVLALTISFDETFVTFFLAGDTTTLPLRLWGMMRVGFSPEINALVTIVLGVSITLAAIVALRLNPRGTLEEE